MVEMQSKVTIKSKLTGLKLVFKQHLKSAKITRGYKSITQTATVQLPRFNKLLDPGEPNYKIRVGDEITIELGYDGKFNTEFEGYIVQIKSTVPLELLCEDEMWINKQISVNKAWKSITMKELVTYLVPGTNTELMPDVTFAPFRIENTNVANALDKLKG